MYLEKRQAIDLVIPRPVRIAGIPHPVEAPRPDPATYRRIRIPKGARGTRETMEKMAELAAEAARDPYFIQEARGIARGVPSRDDLAVADRVLQAVKSGVDYRGDSYEMDWLQSPGWTWFVEGQGDCDDMAILICSFDLALGYGCRLRSYALDPLMPDEYSHVMAQIGIRGGAGMGEGDGVLWLGQDPVPEDVRLGWEPPRESWIAPPLDLVVALP